MSDHSPNSPRKSSVVHSPNTEVILDSVADGVFTVDERWRITSFNKAAEEITGVTRDDAVGSLCCDIFRANICESECAIRSTLESHTPVVNKAVYIVRPDGQRRTISVSAAALKDEDGSVVGGVETFRDMTVVEQLRKALLKETSFADIISQNHEMRRIFAILPAVGESESTVLIEGPSGSGKELVARAVHNLSPRKERPFVAVNCGAIPDTLLESELFGYKKGAFTDAHRDKPGRFAVAEKGTLFLDEIGDISAAMQARLLRVLQEREYEPLGSNKPVKTDVRVLAATNKPLDELVEQDLFREDLFYRLNVVRIKVPPLSRRKEDIPLLVDHFVDRLNVLKNKDITGVSEEAMGILLDHDYPGNVRELQNFIEHAFILCSNGLIQPDHLPFELLDHYADQPHPIRAESFDQLESRFIREALARNQFNQAATARELNIHKTTLWRKMKKLGIVLPAKK